MFVSIQVQGRAPEGPVKEHLERRLRSAAAPYGQRVLGVALRATEAGRGRIHCRVALSLDTGIFTGAGKGTSVLFAAEEALTRATRNANRILRREDRPFQGLFLTPRPSPLG